MNINMNINMNKNIITIICKKLDLNTVYNIQLIFGVDDISLIEKIIDNFNAYNEYVYNISEIVKKLVHFPNIMNPSENLLNYLRENNYNLSENIILHEIQINNKFLLYYPLSINKFYDSKTIKSLINDYRKLYHRTDFNCNNVTIIKILLSSYIELPYSVYEYYKNKNNNNNNNNKEYKEYVNNKYECNEFQDWFPLDTINNEYTIMCNCNSKSREYGIIQKINNKNFLIKNNI